MRGARWPVWLVILLALAAEMAPLPEALAPARPPWTAMVMIYWVLMWPGRFGVLTAWLVGLVLDVAQGTLLGQHAFVLAGQAWLVVRFHLQMRVFPLWQLTLSVFALIGLGEFLLLWIDGITGPVNVGIGRWGPVLAAGILWPLLMAAMDRMRERLDRRDSSFA